MERAKDLGVLYLASFDLLPHLRGASALQDSTPNTRPKGSQLPVADAAQ